MKDLKIKMIKPVFTGILTTCEKYEEDKLVSSGILIDTKKMRGTIKPYQKVLEVGNSVTLVKPGDLIAINPSRYYTSDYKAEQESIRGADPTIHMKNTPKFELPVIEFDKKEFLLLDQHDIDFIITEYENK